MKKEEKEKVNQIIQKTEEEFFDLHDLEEGDFLEYNEQKSLLLQQVGNVFDQTLRKKYDVTGLGSGFGFYIEDRIRVSDHTGRASASEMYDIRVLDNGKGDFNISDETDIIPALEKIEEILSQQK
jgi:hypothetical protein